MASRDRKYLHYGTAIKKCRDTPEILEMILAQMDMRTLLTSAQRVSRSWFNLISTSPSIQKALFFTPIKDSEWGIGAKILNPLLTETFVSLFPAKGKSYSCCFDICDLPMAKDALIMTRFARKDASWRKMLVQQPPVSGIGLFPLLSSRGHHGVNCYSIPADQKMQESGHNGLRMERLFEVLLLTRFTSPHVYWSPGKSIEFDRSNSQVIKDAFDLQLSKSGLVLCTETAMPCDVVPSPRRPPSAAQIIREKIIAAFREQGLDADLKRKCIRESQVGGDFVGSIDVLVEYGACTPPPPRRTVR
ncbi:uncharacterized protein N7484_003521 [Penicillium longicatenatum]|uniref:uncharacterized protein n=1 Tax=Penicillium longicatenatum TaxID=1561947 RepID=UPI002547C2B7|nr:uncharacterized protein N7484_003521 [Penicillium longicatenatum]KAJ5649798.1 hypothetical protein N7484_003521 [Penicillium longicatenatum]